MPRQEIPEELLGPDGFLEGRFISSHARYTVAIDPGHERLITDSRGNSFLHKESDPVIAQFEQSGMREHEIEEAFTRWTFSGLAEGRNPVTTIGIYDVEMQAHAGDWTDEKRHEVERKLYIESVAHPGDLAYVPSPRAPKPWPSYDQDTVEEILDFQRRLDFDPEKVRLYEDENQRREEIMSAMFELEAAGARGSSVTVATVGA